MADVLKCSKCAETKRTADFWRDRTRKRGYHAWCKDCCRRSNYVYETSDWPRTMILTLRSKSKRLGIPFNLVKSDIIVPEKCPILGIKLEHKRGKGGGGQDASPSIDRLKPELGYVKGNVVVLSNKANRIKSNATSDDVQRVATWMKGRNL